MYVHNQLIFSEITIETKCTTLILTQGGAFFLRNGWQTGNSVNEPTYGYSGAQYHANGRLKYCYNSENDTRGELQRLKATSPTYSDSQRLESYYCTECGYWHIGHVKKR